MIEKNSFLCYVNTFPASVVLFFLAFMYVSTTFEGSFYCTCIENKKLGFSLIFENSGSIGPVEQYIKLNWPFIWEAISEESNLTSIYRLFINRFTNYKWYHEKSGKKNQHFSVLLA